MLSIADTLHSYNGKLENGVSKAKKKMLDMTPPSDGFLGISPCCLVKCQEKNFQSLKEMEKMRRTFDTYFFRLTAKEPVIPRLAFLILEA